MINNSEPTLLIMAAGMGSRFGGLKQITPISGKDEVILDFSLFDALKAGFKKVVLVIKEENLEDFHRLLDNKAAKQMDIKYAFQKLDDLPKGYSIPEGRVKPWGTAHAVLAARDIIDSNFCVINSDDYYGPGAFKLMYDFLKNAKDDSKYQYSMVGYMVENTLTENGHVSRGVCETDSLGNLKTITERTKIMWKGEKIVYLEQDPKNPEKTIEEEVKKGTTVSMNFWGFTKSFMKETLSRFPEFLNTCEPIKGEYLLPKAVDVLIKEGKADAKVLKSPDRWYGVTYKEDKDKVTNALQALKDNGVYPQSLWG